MTTYYVDPVNGSDANAGTSTGAPWLTMAKALGASGIASGDTCYVFGGSVIGEAVSVAMTSATTETQVIADITGAYTGRAGPVVWQTRTGGSFAPTTATSCLNLAGRDYLTLRGFTFYAPDSSSSGVNAITATTSVSTNIVIEDCLFRQGLYGTSALIQITVPADTTMTWRIERCIFLNRDGNSIEITYTKSTVGHYTGGFVIRNCLDLGGGQFLRQSSTGASTYPGGGALVDRCTVLNAYNGVWVDSGSPNYPVIVQNSYLTTSWYNMYCGTTANTTVEDNNVLSNYSRNQLQAGTASYAALRRTPHLGSHEPFTGQRSRPVGTPEPDSILGGFGALEIAVGTFGTFASSNANGGTVAWTTPSNAARADDTRTTASAIAQNATTELLNCTNPTWQNAPTSGATILGIRIEHETQASAGSSVSFNGGASSAGFKLIKGGSIVGDLVTDSSVMFGGADAMWNIGSHATLWGTTWADTDFGSTFGVSMAARNTNAATRDCSVDFVRVIVYWRPSTPTTTVDLYNRPRPAGGYRWVAGGTASSATATTLTHSGASFPANSGLAGATLYIVSGTGSGQAKHIKSNTATAITVYGNWSTTPDNTSVYVVYFGGMVETFTATSGGTTTITQSSASWPTNMFAGCIAEIASGTGSGQKRAITSNSGTVLTLVSNQPFNPAPDNTSVINVYHAVSVTAVNESCGALERHDTAVLETATTDAGGVGWKLAGYADQEIAIPVNAASTTISLKMRYDSAHGTTNKPRAVLLASPEIGVTTETKTMTSGADTWETLTFSAFTPSATGVVTVRLEARAGLPYGRAYVDTLAVA